MIEIIKADGQAERIRIAAMRARAAQVGADIERAVSAVMEEVNARGYEAVKEYSLKFDHKEPYELTPADLEAAGRSWGPQRSRMASSRSGAACSTACCKVISICCSVTAHHLLPVRCAIFSAPGGIWTARLPEGSPAVRRSPGASAR